VVEKGRREYVCPLGLIGKEEEEEEEGGGVLMYYIGRRANDQSKGASIYQFPKIDISWRKCGFSCRILVHSLPSNRRPPELGPYRSCEEIEVRDKEEGGGGGGGRGKKRRGHAPLH